MRWLPAMLLTVPLLGACSADDPTVLALLVADASGGVSRAVDAEVFEARVQSTCGGCEVAVYDAGGDPEEQESQVRQAVADSADVVVVEPVDPSGFDGEGLGEVPLVSTGSLVPGSHRYVGPAQDDASPAGSSPAGSSLDPEPATVLDAARDVLLGERDSFVYVPVQAMSEQVADVAVGVVADEPVEGGEEHEGVTSWLFDTQRVDRSNLATVVLGQQAVTLDELCAGATARRCTRLGLR